MKARGEIVEQKRFDMEPMFAEDAIGRMEELGHAFFVFLNAESNAICVVYRRQRRRLRGDRAGHPAR